MKTIKIVLFCLFPFSMLNAQQLEVVSSGGGYHENSQGSIAFSIGEVVIETITYGDICFTQGFCQINIISPSIGDIATIDYQVLTYPNPVTQFLMLKITKDNLTDLKYLLFDINGRMLEMRQIVSNETMIPVHFLAPSTYYLKIIDKQLEVKTFKIIKSN